jgi:hypothetical protein
VFERSLLEAVFQPFHAATEHLAVVELDKDVGKASVTNAVFWILDPECLPERDILDSNRECRGGEASRHHTGSFGKLCRSSNDPWDGSKPASKMRVAITSIGSNRKRFRHYPSTEVINLSMIVLSVSNASTFATYSRSMG